jgi:hypothetical protein
MSTRTTVKICNDGEVIVTLYRHMDGYLAETGADLLETIRASKYADIAVRALLDKTYEKSDYETQPRHIYSVSGTHGDIEHYYVVSFSYDSETTIFHAARPANFRELEWINVGDFYTLDQFAEVVNKDRVEINERIAELKRIYPKQYEDAELYPMV